MTTALRNLPEIWRAMRRWACVALFRGHYWGPDEYVAIYQPGFPNSVKRTCKYCPTAMIQWDETWWAQDKAARGA